MEATDEAVHDALDGSFEGNCQRSSYACCVVLMWVCVATVTLSLEELLN